MDLTSFMHLKLLFLCLRQQVKFLFFNVEYFNFKRAPENTRKSTTWEHTRNPMKHWICDLLNTPKRKGVKSMCKSHKMRAFWDLWERVGWEFPRQKTNFANTRVRGWARKCSVCQCGKCICISHHCIFLYLHLRNTNIRTQLVARINFQKKIYALAKKGP